MTTNGLGYRISLLTYLVLLGLDTLRPGFVSSAFSVHLLLIPVAGFAWGWSKETGCSRDGWLDVIVLFAFSVAGGLLVWIKGEAFGDARLLLALGVALFPWFALQGKHQRT